MQTSAQAQYGTQEWIVANAERVLAVDIDGTLTEGGKWQGEEHFYKLRPLAQTMMQVFRHSGYFIILHTVRQRKDLVSKWAIENGIPFDAIETKPYATVYLDDRAVRYENGWAQAGMDVVSKMYPGGKH